MSMNTAGYDFMCGETTAKYRGYLGSLSSEEKSEFVDTLSAIMDNKQVPVNSQVDMAMQLKQDMLSGVVHWFAIVDLVQDA